VSCCLAEALPFIPPPSDHLLYTCVCFCESVVAESGRRERGREQGGRLTVNGRKMQRGNQCYCTRTQKQQGGKQNKQTHKKTLVGVAAPPPFVFVISLAVQDDLSHVRRGGDGEARGGIVVVYCERRSESERERERPLPSPPPPLSRRGQRGRV
jgi:hypothetical protein